MAHSFPTRRSSDLSVELVRRTKSVLSLSRALTDPAMAAGLEQVAQDWSVRQPDHTEAVRRVRERVRR